MEKKEVQELREPYKGTEGYRRVIHYTCPRRMNEVKTRKEHSCLICKKVIPKGSSTLRMTLLFPDAYYVDSEHWAYWAVYFDGSKCLKKFVKMIAKKSPYRYNIVKKSAPKEYREKLAERQKAWEEEEGDIYQAFPLK